MGRSGLGFQKLTEQCDGPQLYEPGEANPWNALLGQETNLTICFFRCQCETPRQTPTRSRLSYQATGRKTTTLPPLPLVAGRIGGPPRIYPRELGERIYPTVEES